jgi:hypothetical protein
MQITLRMNNTNVRFMFVGAKVAGHAPTAIDFSAP